MGKKLVFSLITAGLMLCLLEVMAYLAYWLVDDIYDHRQTVLESLNERELAEFVEAGGDPVLGWDSRGPKVTHEQDCTGSEVQLTYDALGARVYGAYNGARVQIIAVGDSYTQGAEAGDEAAYPAELADILGTSVANHGVGGYGPTQSFLKLKQKFRAYPKAKVVVLGIMYENIYRMVNSYRSVLYENDFRYGLKPYMSGGKIKPHPGPQALADFQVFRDYAARAFDEDFWVKPKRKFPYLISLVRALSSNYAYYRKLQKRFRGLGFPEYFLAFRSDDFSSELVALLQYYAEFAAGNNVAPVAVFIPRNRYDTESASRFIEANRNRFHPALVLGDVGSSAHIDWDAFNLERSDTNDICHPSAYGYRKIAEFIANLLRRRGLWPADSIKLNYSRIS